MFGKFLRNFNEVKMKKTIFLTLICLSSIIAQPYVFSVYSIADSSDFIQIDSFKYYKITKDYIQKTDVKSNNITHIFDDGERIYQIFLSKHDSTLIVIKENSWIIYDIYGDHVLYTIPAMYDCIEDLIFIDDKLFGFTCENVQNGELAGNLFQVNLQTGSLTNLFLFQYDGGVVNVTASANFNYLFFSTPDTNYILRRDDLNYLNSFSTTTYQVTNKRLSEWGYPNADGYYLFKGRDGKAIVSSFYKNPTEDKYYRIVNFDENTESNFIFYQGSAKPYFTGSGEYLVVAETSDSAANVVCTGRFFIYDVLTKQLIKTLTYPMDGIVYTFDNYPNDIYYVRNIETQPEIYNLTKLKLNSITPGLSLPYTSGLEITLQGGLFTPSSQVYFNNQPRTTTYLSDTTLSVQLNAGDLSTVGNYPLYVSNYGSNSDTLTYTVVSSLPQSITPLVECVKNNGGSSYTAKFGYRNDNTKSVFVPVGANNKFSPTPENRNQPTIFLPGRNYDVFSVNFDGRNLTWNVFKKKVTASKNSTPCP